MKTIAVLGLFAVLWTGSAFAVDVDGYFRKDGTYVAPHRRTAPDSNPYNNYSYPGNYNPNTGRESQGNADTYKRNYDNNSNPFGGSNSPTPKPWWAK